MSGVRHHVRMADAAPHRAPRRLTAAVAVLLAGSAPGLAGCGSASPPSAPSGVDLLVIPTPSLDPGDFVGEVDNPFLPLAPGSRWTYELSGEQTGTVSVTVADERQSVAGVEATVVETTAPDGSTVDYYAQDRSGNVWWVGREGVWAAGADGAEAGLAMAARPRVGDGYRMASSPGVVEDRALVRSVTSAVTVPAGSYEECVDVETSSPLEPGVRRISTYAEGVGLVRLESVEGPRVLLELVEAP